MTLTRFLGLLIDMTPTEAQIADIETAADEMARELTI